MTQIKSMIKEANEKVLEKILSGQPHWVGMRPALEVIPGMKENYILHSGPPMDWERMKDIQQKGILGGILHERLAGTEDEALKLIESGEIKYFPANDFGAIGPGVGITTPSMIVNVCRNLDTGIEGYCIPFEGRIGLGAWGVYNEEVEKDLQTIKNILAPAIDGVLQGCGGIDIKSIIARGMQMNDETHSRQTAQGLILVGELVPLLIKSSIGRPELVHCVEMLVSTERWFHPLGMAGALSIAKSIKNVEYSTIVTAFASNGVDIGIKISALGDQWFTASSPAMTGAFFSTQWGPGDALDLMGDSIMTETMGLGGFAAAAAPGVVRLRGGTIRDAIQQTEEMKSICVGINHNYPIPLLEFSGPPVGIDIRKVIDTGITPVCHGGILSVKGGQIGAGIARLPMEPFVEALHAFVDKYNL